MQRAEDEGWKLGKDVPGTRMACFARYYEIVAISVEQ
jgi:hypothetical protein